MMHRVMVMIIRAMVTIIRVMIILIKWVPISCDDNECILLLGTFKSLALPKILLTVLSVSRVIAILCEYK